MPSGNADDIFKRLLAEKHEAVKQALSTLWYSLVFEDAKVKVQKARELRGSIELLQANLATEDQPEWCDHLLRHSASYVNHSHDPATRHDLLDVLHRWRYAVSTHKWNFGAEDDAAIDFGSIVRDAKAASQMPAIFDRLVKMLEDCLASDAIDSVKARAALERLLSTLRAKESRTFFGMVSTGRFAKAFIQNWLIGELKKLPVAGGVVEAFQKTADELGEEDRKLFELVNSKNQALAKAEWEKLPGCSESVAEVAQLQLTSLSVEGTASPEVQDDLSDGKQAEA